MLTVAIQMFFSCVLTCEVTRFLCKRHQASYSVTLHCNNVGFINFKCQTPYVSLHKKTKSAIVRFLHSLIIQIHSFSLHYCISVCRLQLHSWHHLTHKIRWDYKGFGQSPIKHQPAWEPGLLCEVVSFLPPSDKTIRYSCALGKASRLHLLCFSYFCENSKMNPTAFLLWWRLSSALFVQDDTHAKWQQRHH